MNSTEYMSCCEDHLDGITGLAYVRYLIIECLMSVHTAIKDDYRQCILRRMELVVDHPSPGYVLVEMIRNLFYDSELVIRAGYKGYTLELHNHNRSSGLSSFTGIASQNEFLELAAMRLLHTALAYKADKYLV